MQLCGKHISTAVNQHATIEEAVFSVGAAPRLCNEDLMHLEWVDQAGGIWNQRQQDVVLSPAGLGPENDCAGEAQQQF
jgi:hypothetical protein